MKWRPHIFRMVKWYRLRDWQTGPFIVTTPSSELIDFLLYADWFNFDHQNRLRLMRDIRESYNLMIAPTRLGAILRIQPRAFPKRWFCAFIRLYDTRVIEPSLFRVMTVKEYFKEFARRLNKPAKKNSA